MVDLGKSLKEVIRILVWQFDNCLIATLYKSVDRQKLTQSFNFKASFDFNICCFSKRASLSEINPILPSKTNGFLRTIGSAFNRMCQGGVIADDRRKQVAKHSHLHLG